MTDSRFTKGYADELLFAALEKLQFSKALVLMDYLRTVCMQRVIVLLHIKIYGDSSITESPMLKCQMT